MKKNLLKVLSLSFIMACSFAVVSCGEEEIIEPTPTPTPTPTPDKPTETTYSGIYCEILLDSIAGSKEDAAAFSKLWADSLAVVAPSFKQANELTYKVSATYTDDDKTAYGKIEAERKEIMQFISRMRKTDLTTPIVTTIFTLSKVNASNVKKDWTYEGGSMSASSSSGNLALPIINNTEWKTTDDKGLGVETVKFGKWLNDDNDQKATIKSSTLTVNGENVANCTLTRTGAEISVKDENGATKYAFSYTADGKQIVLKQLNGAALEEKDFVSFELQAAAAE